MVTYVKVNREKSHPCEGLRQGYFRSLCSVRVWDSTGQNVKHKEREPANHCVRDGYFKTSECHPDLGNSYYVVNAQNSSGGMSKEASVEKKKKKSVWDAVELYTTLYFACIFSRLYFSLSLISLEDLGYFWDSWTHCYSSQSLLQVIHCLGSCAFTALQTLTLAQLCETASTDKCTKRGGRC